MSLTRRNNRCAEHRVVLVSRLVTTLAVWHLSHLVFLEKSIQCRRELDHNGEQILTECTRIQTIQRKNTDGTFRF